jgi:hypothetical protein
MMQKFEEQVFPFLTFYDVRDSFTPRNHMPAHLGTAWKYCTTSQANTELIRSVGPYKVVATIPPHGSFVKLQSPVQQIMMREQSCE